MTSAESDVRKEARDREGGTEIIDVGVVGDTLWLPSIMEALVARGITRLLVEGGPAIWRAFADASLVDEIVLYMAGKPSDLEAQNAVARWLGSPRDDGRRTADNRHRYDVAVSPPDGQGRTLTRCLPD